MNLKIAVLTLITTLPALAKAQEVVDISLTRKQEVLDFVDLQEQGFIIRTGVNKYYSANLDWHLRYYSPNLQEIWSLPIDTDKFDWGRGQEVVATSTGSYVYHLERKGLAHKNKVGGMRITQVAKDGTVRSHKVDARNFKELKGVEELLFCTPEHLYLVFADKGKHDNPTNVTLSRFSHQDFSYGQFTATLPVIPDEKSVFPWEYAGHSDQRIWFASKSASSKSNTFQCQLVSVDWQGDVSEKVIISDQIENVYLRASMNKRQSAGALVKRSTATKTYVHAHPSGSGTTATTRLLDDGLIGIQVDDRNSTIYVYGLFGKRNQKSSRSHTDGFHLTAYNLKGKQTWRYISTDQAAIVSDGLVYQRLHDSQRETMVSIDDQGVVQLQIRLMGYPYVHKFSLDGQLIEAYRGLQFESQGDEYSLAFPHDSSAGRYYKEEAAYRKAYYGSCSPKGQVLIEYDGKKRLSLRRW